MAPARQAKRGTQFLAPTAAPDSPCFVAPSDSLVVQRAPSVACCTAASETLPSTALAIYRLLRIRTNLQAEIQCPTRFRESPAPVPLETVAEPCVVSESMPPALAPCASADPNRHGGSPVSPTYF